MFFASGINDPQIHKNLIVQNRHIPYSLI